MIVDNNRPHRRRHERPPREPSDRGDQQPPPSEPQISLGRGDINFATGVREGRRSPVARSTPVDESKKYVPLEPDKFRIMRMNGVRRSAQLALTAEQRQRQVLRVYCGIRWRRYAQAVGKTGSRPPTSWQTDWALGLAERLRRHAQRHGDTPQAEGALSLAAQLLTLA